MAKRAPIHPGEILKTEFLDELDLSAYALAQAPSVPTNRVTGIVNGERSITAETALRLARFFGTTPEFWLSLQMHYDLTVAARQDARRIDREVVEREAPALPVPVVDLPDAVPDTPRARRRARS